MRFCAVYGTGRGVSIHPISGSLHHQPVESAVQCASLVATRSDRLTSLPRPLPDERPRASVANLIGKFEQQVKKSSSTLR